MTQKAQSPAFEPMWFNRKHCNRYDPLIEDEYECDLDDKTKEIAKVELREDEQLRSHALFQFRNWIRSQKYITNCRMDSNFLLRFLRVRKFSLSLAQEALLNYLTTRATFPEWYRNLDSEDLVVKDVLKRGYLFPCIETDLSGRPIGFFIPGVIDPKKHTMNDVLRAALLACEAMLEDEFGQIRGGTYIIDLKNVGIEIISMFNPLTFYKIVSSGVKAIPGRHKQIHFINMGPVAVKLVQVALKACNKKIQERVTIHENAEDCFSKFPARILPKEYGGVTPKKEMIDKFVWLLEKNRANYLLLDKIQLDTKWAEERADELFNDIMGCTGNFRKLELD